MRFTSKGIGWLIAGGIICATAISSDSLTSAIGTALFGLVFVAVYFIKQFFDPAGTGWFIAGGILLAFCIETLLGVTAGALRNSFLDRDSLSDVLISLIIAGGCFFAFYRRNKGQVDDLAADMGMDIYRPEPPVMQDQQPVVEPVASVETMAAEPVAPAAEPAETDIEFEIETKDETGTK